MPKMPGVGGRGLVTPLVATRPKPVFVDRSSDICRLLTLRPAHVTDEIAEWLADPEIIEGLNAPTAAMGLDAFRAYVESYDNLRRSLIAIRLQPDNRPVGLLMLEVDLRHKLGSLHIVIGKAQDRSLKLAFEATRLLCWHFFTERKLEKLTFQPLARNTAAVVACRRAMLRLEATLRSHRIDGRTGERIDQFVFGLTLDEFRQRMLAAEAVQPNVYEGPGLPRTWVRDALKAFAAAKARNSAQA